MNMVTLTCSAGHEWLRPSQRGRKPSACPVHAEPKPVPNKRTREAVEVVAEIVISEISEIIKPLPVLSGAARGAALFERMKPLMGKKRELITR